MERTTRMIFENGRTFSMWLGGSKYLWTCEPENVKALLISKAEDFEIM